MVREPRRPTPPRGLRAVVTDVDGTLTSSDRRLDPRAVAVVRALEERGIPVVLATGNVLPISLALYRFLGLSGPIVAENGGIVYRRLGGRDIVDRLADPAAARAAFRVLERSGLPVRRLFTDRWRETEVALEPNVPVEAVRRVLGRRRVQVESTGFAIHLMEEGRGKLPALVRALRPLGLEPRHCLVLGDGDNDVGILRAAGYGVSFPSASPSARSAATYVTRADSSGGFVEGVKASGILEGRRRIRRG
jgi:phosphoglycolate phosphatase